MNKAFKIIASLLLFVALSIPVTAQTAVVVDFSKFDPASAIFVSKVTPDILEANWADRVGTQFRVQFNLKSGTPLLANLETAPKTGAEFTSVARDVDSKFRITLGTRRIQAGWPYIFFDKVPANTPAPTAHLSSLNLTNVTVVSESVHRVKIVFSTLAVGPNSGDLTCYIYEGSPLLHLQASMRVDQPWVAYIYDMLAYGDFSKVAYKDLQGTLQSVEAATLTATVPGEPAGVKAKHRTIMAQTSGGHGTLAVVAPPHTSLYPLDRSVNYGFLQAGQGFIGTKMSYLGDNGYVPWIGAEQGATQRMDGFILISTNEPAATLGQVLAYTHGDSYKPVPGHFTMAEHFHPEFTQAHLNGKDELTPFKETMKSLGVQILQPMEFHLGRGRMHPVGDTTNRLAELNDMYRLFQEQSDDNFILIPGEEYNEFFGGHWSYMFPHPVYFTGWHGQKDKEFKLTNVVSGGVTYPVVYQVGDAEAMLKLLEAEGGLAWSSHPRIKDSQQTPDSIVNTDFYRSSQFMAGDWKAMPADLSKDRLGSRAFQLMDDTAQWGYQKSMLGEVDTFELNPTHEIYGNMNINYLELPAFPSKTNWSSVAECVQKGRFFTTTGEMLIHSWSNSDYAVTATLEWYFPPAFAEISWGEASGVHKKRFSLLGEMEFGKKTITIDADLTKANWVRFEAWDVARNGAFTQIRWLKSPSNPKVVAGSITGFTLIDADNDCPVPGYDPIPEKSILDRSKLPVNLTLRANTSPMILEKLVFDLDGAQSTQSKWPYCSTPCLIKSGMRGCPFYDYLPSALTAGPHVAAAIPWLASTTGKTATLHFTVVGSASENKSDL